MLRRAPGGRSTTRSPALTATDARPDGGPGVGGGQHHRQPAPGAPVGLGPATASAARGGQQPWCSYAEEHLRDSGRRTTVTRPGSAGTVAAATGPSPSAWATRSHRREVERRQRLPMDESTLVRSRGRGGGPRLGVHACAPCWTRSPPSSPRGSRRLQPAERRDAAGRPRGRGGAPHAGRAGRAGRGDARVQDAPASPCSPSTAGAPRRLHLCRDGVPRPRRDVGRPVVDAGAAPPTAATGSVWPSSAP